jgi:hypothetical protein
VGPGARLPKNKKNQTGMAGLGVQVKDGNIAHIGDFVHTYAV